VISYAAYSVPDRFDTGDLDLGGDTLYAGGGLGIEFRPAFGIHVMPAVEVQRSVSRRGNIDDLPVIDMLFFGVTFGWGSRREPVREPSVPSECGADSRELRRAREPTAQRGGVGAFSKTMSERSQASGSFEDRAGPRGSSALDELAPPAAAANAGGSRMMSVLTGVGAESAGEPAGAVPGRGRAGATALADEARAATGGAGRGSTGRGVLAGARAATSGVLGAASLAGAPTLVGAPCSDGGGSTIVVGTGARAGAGGFAAGC
jgi:hypothetical protein